MKIVIVGYGWVGQANALALSSMGNEVYFFDPKEPTLHYSDSYGEIYPRITKLASPLEQDSPDTSYLICVGDRVDDLGIQDISLVEEALNSIIETKGVIVLRSTILPEKLSSLKFDFYLPEFLHEKKAVEECLDPHFFVVGSTTDKKEPQFFKAWEARTARVFRGTPEEASYVKYLSNIWNAVRIAFTNEFGDAILKAGNITSPDKIIDFVLERGLYLRYGKAFGGHCLPKDIRAFIRQAKDNDFDPALIDGAYKANEAHARLQTDLPEWYSEWKPVK